MKGIHIKNRHLLRFFSASVSIILLLAIAWLALSGGIDQISRSLTSGQLMQTIVQIICGFLSVAVILSTFIGKSWAKSFQHLWTASFVLTAAMSALVWGPAMPIIAMVFGIAAFLVAKWIVWLMNNPRQKDGD